MDSSMDMGATRMDTKSIAERVVTSLTLPWLVSITLLGFLAVAGGLWNLVANTRVLNLMIEGGVVRFHDKQIGPIDGGARAEVFHCQPGPNCVAAPGAGPSVHGLFLAFEGASAGDT